MNKETQDKIIGFINEKKPAEVRMLCQAVLADEGEHPKTLMYLALSYMMQGDFATAIQHLTTAREYDGDNLNLISNLASCNCQLGNFQAGIALMSQGLEKDPSNKAFMSTLAKMYADVGAYAFAARCLKDLIAQGDSQLATKNRLFDTLFKAQEYPRALSLLEEIAAQTQLTPQHLFTKLKILNAMGKISEVKTVLEQLTQTYPDFIARYYYAPFYRDIGDFDSVHDIFKDTKINRSLNPEILAGYLEHMPPNPETLLQCEHYLNEKVQGQAQHVNAIHIYGIAIMMAQAYKALNNTDKYRYWLKAANDLMTRQPLTDYHKAFDILGKIKPLYRNIKLPLVAASEITPIFILGMPRSGSTLLESILSTHSEIDTGGELFSLINAINETIPPLYAGSPFEKRSRYMEHLSEFSQGDMERIAHKYLDDIQHYAAPGCKYIIDKMPSNFQEIGLIAQLFPNAKIIHIKRNPVSTCFSIYEQYLSMFHDYRHDLTTLADFYLHFSEVMAFWQEYLPEGKMYSLEYETLVAEPEQSLDKLFDYLGLPMEAGLLEFYKQERGVRTVSAKQVRQPLYKKDKESWQDVQDMITPLLDKLARVP